MKVLTAFDPHGQINYIPTDEEIERVDKVVFGGDYWDSFDLYESIQIRVFLKIVAIKRKYGDKIEVILGNHDIQYLYRERVSSLRCSGFSSDYFITINQLMVHNKDIFVYAWQHEDHLFTHAGVTQDLLDRYSEKRPQQYQMVLDGEISLADLINECKISDLYVIGHKGTGMNRDSGIFWIRPKYLDAYQPEGYIQHVGHTHVEGIPDKYLESKTLNYYDGLGKHVIEI